MTTKNELPPALWDFARSTTGPYPARYEQILEEAFTNHKLLLTAAPLRQLAGGGSNSTAQAAVETFRSELQEKVSSRIEFGAEIPPEVSERMSAVLSDLWTTCMKAAASDFAQEREGFEASLAQAQQQQEQLRLNVNELSAIEFEMRSEVRHVNEANVTLRAEISRLNGTQKALEDKEATLQRSILDKDLKIAALTREATELKGQLQGAIEQHRSALDSLKQEFRTQSSELKRENEAALGRLVKERDEARATEARERAGHAETTIKLARVEQRLAQSATDVATGQEAARKAQAEATQLREDINKINAAHEALITDLNAKFTKEQQDARDLQAQQVSLLKDIQASLQSKKSNDNAVREKTI